MAEVPWRHLDEGCVHLECVQDVGSAFLEEAWLGVPV